MLTKFRSRITYANVTATRLMSVKPRQRPPYPKTPRLASAAVGATLLLVPSSSLAATTIGSDLSTPPDSGFFCIFPCSNGLTLSQDQLPGSTVRAPEAGVVVRWRVRGGSGELGFRVLDEGANDDVATGAGTDTETLPGAPPGDPAVRTFDARLPIGAGDRIGVDHADNASVGARSTTAGATVDQWNPRLPDGTTRTAEGPDTNAELLLNADIEPDQDRDGLGDETQDPYPHLAGDPQPGACANTHVGGTPGPDVLTGTPFGDVIRGQAGNDAISGLAGADCLFGEAGNDRLSGGSSRDRLSGGSGRDRLSGGSGNDRLSGGSGNDVLRPGPGRDRVSCGRGRDKVRGAGRRDRLSGC
jgi:Ca2+-binding RTX toxin-like protein